MRDAGQIIGVVILVLVALFLVAGLGMMGFGAFGMMGGRGMMGGFGYNTWGWFWSLIFLALIVGGVAIAFWLVRNPGTSSTSPLGQKDTPLDTLKMRYARGEITKAQFDEMRRDLES